MISAIFLICRKGAFAFGDEEDLMRELMSKPEYRRFFVQKPDEV